MEAVEIFDDALFKHDFNKASDFLGMINIDEEDDSGNTYLMKACMKGDLKVFNWLIEKGANLSMQNKSGRNILFAAIHSDSLEILKWLIVNTQLLNTTYKEHNPLHQSILDRRLSMVKLLIAAGINPDVQNKNNANAFDLALTVNDEAILEWLLTDKSFKILDEVQGEQAKVTALQDLFDKYGYQYLNKWSPERNLTIAKYAASMHQSEVLQWLKFKNIPVDETVCTTTPTTSTHFGEDKVVRVLQDLFDQHKNQYTKNMQSGISKLLKSDPLDETSIPVMVPITDVDISLSGHTVIAPKINIEDFEAALFKHNYDVAQRLLPKVNIETPDYNGCTYLMKACVNNDAEAFKWLIQHEANLDVQDKSGRNILFTAIHFKSVGILKWLIENKQLLNTVYKGRRPLHEAVLSNQLDMVKLLVDAGTDPEVLTQSEMNAFDLAQTQKDKVILEWLLTYRSFKILDDTRCEDIEVAMLQNLFDKYGYQYLNLWFVEKNLTLAQYAAQIQHVQVLEWLKSKNIHLDETLLSDAPRRNAEPIYAAINFNPYEYRESIQTKATNGFQSKTISVDATLSQDMEVFEAALFQHNFDVALKLLPNINIEAQDYNGNTCLMKACVNNDGKVFDWLIQYGAKINVKDKFGKNPLFVAIEAQSVDIVKRLADDKRLLRSTYKDHTSLHKAILVNHLDMVKLLVTAGLDPNVPGRSNANAFDMAETQSDKLILRWLLMNRSFEILDEDQREQDKIAMLEQLFVKYGYQYLNSTFAPKTLTIAEYAANTKQVEVLNWLKSRNVRMPETVLYAVTSNEEEPMNILLLGETGVGKSTFINALANYRCFGSLDQAVNAKTIYAPIPSHFIITDSCFQAHAIQCGQHVSETRGASSIQAAKTWLFNYDNVKIQFIDTPGIGDSEGVGKDEENFEKLLEFIGNMKNVHGICIMLKPNNARLNILLEYCIKGLLPRLHKNASQNIMFIFTNSRGSFYKPGDTIDPLQNILRQMESQPPYVSIPLNKDNVFCVDNEGLRYLLAKKSPVLIKFNEEEVKHFSDSWTKSAEVCKRLITHIKSLKLHRVQETVSLNEVHRRISRVGVVLAEATQYIEMNIRRCKRYTNELNDPFKNMTELKEFLVVPTIDLKIIPLSYPATVCTNQRCVKVIRIEGISHKKFSKLCHSPCYLRGVSEKIAGESMLSKCCAMEDKDDMRICKQSFCGHYFREHMHINYIIEIQERDVSKIIDNRKIKRQDIEKGVMELRNTLEQYEDEMNIILQTMAKFAYYLKYQGIVPYKDTYKKYMEFLIDSEKEMTDTKNEDLIKRYAAVMSMYEDLKNCVENYLASSSETYRNEILADKQITNLVEKLYKLPRTGKIIKDLHRY